MEESKSKGGRKPKPEDQKKKQRPVYATDIEWQEITRLAGIAEMEVSPFVIKKALKK